MTSEILFYLLSIRYYSGFIEKIQSIAIDNSAFTSAQIAIEKKKTLRVGYYHQAVKKKVCYSYHNRSYRFKAYHYFRGRQDCVSVKINFYQDAESYGNK
jgi:hypothetical protein